MSGTKRWMLGTLLLIGVVFIGGAWWASNGITAYKEMAARNVFEAQRETEKLREADKGAKEAISSALKSNTVLAWESATTKVDAIQNKEVRDRLKLEILPKRIAAYGIARDKLLLEAREYFDHNQDDPRIDVLIDKARKPQEEIEKLLKNFQGKNGAKLAEGIPVAERAAWYATMCSLNGHAFYAKLSFLTEDKKDDIAAAIENAKNAFNQTFDVSQRNAQAQHEIEALWRQDQKQKSSSSNSGGDKIGKPKRPAMLPQPTPSSAQSPLGSGV